MNFSQLNLTIFFTKENLTNRFVDYSNVILLPSICFFGVLTSLSCLIGSFKTDDSNATTMNYIFLNSLIDFFFLLIQFWLIFIRCGILCPYAFTYWAKFFEIYIYQYLGYVLVTSQLLLSIYISLDRLSMFSGKPNPKKPSIYLIFVFTTLISAVLNAPPYSISKQVELIGVYVHPTTILNSTNYELLYVRSIRKEFRTSLMQVLLTVCLMFKNTVLFCVCCFINMLVCIRFRHYLNKKMKLVKTKSSSMRKQQQRNFFLIKVEKSL